MQFAFMFHNPQNLTPEQYGAEDGFRLFTHEEAATLTDRQSARSTLGLAVRAQLAPQLFHEGSCMWVSLAPASPYSPPLSEATTYRTPAPMPEDAPPPRRAEDVLSDALLDMSEGFQMFASACGHLAEYFEQFKQTHPAAK